MVFPMLPSVPEKTMAEPDAARGVPLSKVLCDQLETMILSGQMKPGERLNEQQLAQRFGVSRGPIREAVRALEGAGYVEAVTNKGVFVRQVTMAEVRELYDVRAALFGLAGRLLAERAGDAIIARLEGMLGPWSELPPPAISTPIIR
jgi:DNA-binding GntR family transcriptional regulator